MQPGSFLIIWADGQPEQGPFHAPYKLNDEGEELGIFDNETTGYYLIDSVSWGMQTIDISYGRQFDGGMPWVFFNVPTPGYSNEASFIHENHGFPETILFYPNPVSNGFIYFKEPFTGNLTDAMGRILWKGKDVLNIDTGHLPDGLYILTDITGSRAKVLVQ
jgi:hypothetical protein